MPLEDLRREIRQRGERIARAAAVELQADLRRTSPRVTGKLRKNITVRVRSISDVVTLEAVADTDYAAPVIRGARPHIIRAKKAGGFLAFFWPNDPRPPPVRMLPDGRVLFRQVHHPGNEPNPFWETGIRRWRLLLQNAASRLR